MGGAARPRQTQGAMKNFMVYTFLAIVPIHAVSAQRSAPGALRVTVQVQGSMSIEFSADTAGPLEVMRGSASFIVPTVSGSFRPSSAVPGDTDLLISSPFAIRVNKANLASATYMLKASLATADPLQRWRIDGIGISAGSETIIAPAELYGVSNAHALVVSGLPVPAANAIHFSVIAN